jgi:prepilin signal peptidase PulO-like enzyme (type II secretory pathway)
MLTRTLPNFILNYFFCFVFFFLDFLILFTPDWLIFRVVILQYKNNHFSLNFANYINQTVMKYLVIKKQKNMFKATT